jgi:hypothetical protein
MGDKRSAYRILVGKLEGTKPVRRSRRRWEDSIKIELIKIIRDGLECIDLAKDMDQWRALMNTVVNLQVP